MNKIIVIILSELLPEDYTGTELAELLNKYSKNIENGTLIDFYELQNFNEKIAKDLSEYLFSNNKDLLDYMLNSVPFMNIDDEWMDILFCQLSRFGDS